MKKANFFVISAKNNVNFVNGYFDGEFYYYKCDPEKNRNHCKWACIVPSCGIALCYANTKAEIIEESARVKEKLHDILNNVEYMAKHNDNFNKLVSEFIVCNPDYNKTAETKKPKNDGPKMKKCEFYTALKVDGKETAVKVDGYTDGNFCYYKNEYNNWVAIVASVGRAIAYGNTKKQAAENAAATAEQRKEIIEKGTAPENIAAFKKLVNAAKRQALGLDTPETDLTIVHDYTSKATTASKETETVNETTNNIVTPETACNNSGAAAAESVGTVETVSGRGNSGNDGNLCENAVINDKKIMRGAAIGGVESVLTPKNHRTLTESEWKKLLEMKSDVENATRRERMQEIASQLVTAFENAHGDGVPLADGVTGYELLNVDDDDNLLEDITTWWIDSDIGYLEIKDFIDGYFDDCTGKRFFLTIPQNNFEIAEPDPAQITLDDISACEAEATEETVNSSNESESVQPVEASAATGKNDKNIIVISKSEWENICPDYKGKWLNYNNDRPEWIGRRVMMGGVVPQTLMDRGKLLIEGVHFVIENTQKSVQNLHLRV